MWFSTFSGLLFSVKLRHFHGFERKATFPHDLFWVIIQSAARLRFAFLNRLTSRPWKHGSSELCVRSEQSDPTGLSLIYTSSSSSFTLSSRSHPSHLSALFKQVVTWEPATCPGVLQEPITPCSVEMSGSFYSFFIYTTMPFVVCKNLFVFDSKVNDVFYSIPVQALLEDVLMDSCFQAAQQLVSLF